jgi:hypothetical protein
MGALSSIGVIELGPELQGRTGVVHVTERSHAQRGKVARMGEARRAVAALGLAAHVRDRHLDRRPSLAW